MTHRPLLLPTYPEYKPSGIPWLGDIPAHWKAIPLKYVATTIMGQSPPSADCSDEPIGLPFLQGCAEFGLHHPTPVQYCRKPPKTTPPGAILLSVRAPVGRLNMADQEYGIGRGLCAIIPKNEILNTALTRYQLEALQHGLKLASTGSIYDAVRLRDVRSQRLILPPPHEQTAIARYLTHKDDLIQRWLSAKRRLLASLKQLRKSTIHYTVIHGLDPKNTPMKPSGIPWLDGIPAHWQTIPLKFWVRINQAVLPENTDPSYEFRYIDIGSIGTGFRVEEPEKMRFETAPSRARRIVRNGDTIFSTVRTYLKAVWFADDPDDDLICSTGFAVFTPRRNTSPKFVSYVAQSDSFINRVTANSFGVTYPAINTSRLGSLRVPVPPLDEQAAIAEYLDDRIAKIDAATAGTSRLIDLMEQYRKSLIHELVTGARDVRKAAAAIPNAPTPDPSAPTPDPSTP